MAMTANGNSKHNIYYIQEKNIFLLNECETMSFDVCLCSLHIDDNFHFSQ